MSENPEHDQPMPLVSHLTELRTRLLRCVAVIFLIFAGLFSFAQQIYTLVSAPLREHLPANATMIATDVASPFLTPFKLTMIVSLFLAIPFILQQIWGLSRQGCTAMKSASPFHCWCRASSCSMPVWHSPISWYSR